MADPTKCDILIVIPKRDELAAAGAVFGLDVDDPDFTLGEGEQGFECWQVTVAKLAIVIFLGNTQDNASLALATATALSSLDPAVAFCIGTAAGREGEIAYLDVVLAKAVLDATEWRPKAGQMRSQWNDKFDPLPDVMHDIERFVKESAAWREEASDIMAAALGKLDVHADQAVLEKWPVVKDAWTVTTPFLHEDPEFLAKIWGLNARLKAIDMETAGFISACRASARERRWAVVRAISDYGTPESKHDDARPPAGVAAAAITRVFIERGLIRAHPMRVAPQQSREQALSPSNFFARTTMSDFLTTEIPKRFDIPFETSTVSRELTVYDLAALCGSGADIDVELDRLREDYFFDKYSDYRDDADVRQLSGSAWADEVAAIYKFLGIALARADILYVGVGNGRDLPYVCPEFKSLSGVDLSRKMLKQAAAIQPSMKQVRGRAENLRDIADQSCDLYLSLRVFQSSLFDIPAALREAFRVLRPKGALVISIPGGFLDSSGGELRYVPGLLVPGSTDVVDRSRPRLYAERILWQLERMAFEKVGFHQREGDVYVYAEKV